MIGHLMAGPRSAGNGACASSDLWRQLRPRGEWPVAAPPSDSLHALSRPYKEEMGPSPRRCTRIRTRSGPTRYATGTTVTTTFLSRARPSRRPSTSSTSTSSPGGRSSRGPVATTTASSRGASGWIECERSMSLVSESRARRTLARALRVDCSLSRSQPLLEDSGSRAQPSQGGGVAGRFSRPVDSPDSGPAADTVARPEQSDLQSTNEFTWQIWRWPSRRLIRMPCNIIRAKISSASRTDVKSL